MCVDCPSVKQSRDYINCTTGTRSEASEGPTSDYLYYADVGSSLHVEHLKALVKESPDCINSRLEDRCTPLMEVMVDDRKIMIFVKNFFQSGLRCSVTAFRVRKISRQIRR